MCMRAAWLLVPLALVTSSLAPAQQSPIAVIAAAVRDHGLACSNPRDMQPLPRESSADREAWQITCDEGSYAVRFKGGDQGATVEQVGG